MKRAAFSCEVRVQRLNETPGTLKVESPEDLAAYWREKVSPMPWFDAEREMCVAVMLNAKLVALAHALVSIGTLNETLIHPRDVFRPALATGAYGIILAHNHPSGFADPSESDRRMTQRLREAGELLMVPLLDHVILGGAGRDGRGYFSFREAGVL